MAQSASPGRLVIGLTGGIGAGKSTVAQLFAQRGAGIVDTDAIAHELTQAGNPVLTDIRHAFGDHFITAFGGLDRASMRELVFLDPAAKAKLEAILHPAIREHALICVARSSYPYVMLVVPLLVESAAYGCIVDRVLVVDCSEQLQIERTISRSALSQSQVLAIMQAQATREQRLRSADDIITNDGDVTELEHQVNQLHRKYLALQGDN